MTKPTLSIDDLTPEQLQRLQERMAQLRGQAPAAAGIPRRAGSGPAPLSFAQRQIWLQHQLDPGGTLFNVPTVLRLRGELDPRALRRALDELVRRHELLRTTFELLEEGPVQVVALARGAPLAEADLSGEEDPEAAALERAGAESARPFDMAEDPPFRAALLRVGPRDHVLALVMHHVARDRWTSGVLMGEIAALYRAFREGAPSPLPEPRIQFADYAVWERERLRGETLDRLLAFWSAHLDGAPSPQSPPADHPRGSRPMELVRLPLPVPADTAGALRRLAREESGTAYMVLLAVYLVLLRGYTGEDDLVLGTYVGGRTRPETERLVGSLANTLVLRFRVEDGAGFRGLLRQVRAVVLDAQRHQELPFERLVEELQPVREPGRTPLIRSAFNVSRAAPANLELPGVEVEVLPFAAGGAGVDVHWALEEWDEGIVGHLEYDAGLYLAATAERLAAAYLRLLDAAVAAPDTPLDALPLLAPAERDRLLHAWNDTRRAHPAGACVHGLFAASAARTPHAVAVEHRSGTLTYAELDARAGRLASALRARGVGPDVRVGLCLERGPELMAALLAVLKAGGAYVPLDPAYPAERLSYMLRDSGAHVLLTQQALAGRVGEFGGETVVVDTPHLPAPYSARGEGENDNDTSGAEEREALPQNWGRVASLSEPGGGTPADASTASAEQVAVLPSPLVGEGPGVRGEPVVHPDNLAYVIYTSGSTGTPKGVALPHRALVNLLRWQDAEWRHPEAAATLQFTTVGFDVSFQEIFSCWLSGGRLVLVDEDERRDLGAVLDRLDRARVERLFLPYVALQHLAELGEERGVYPAALREVQTAGEQLRVTEPIRRWLAETGAALSNQYGPSETHVATALALEGDPAGWPLLPAIGRPIANARCYVLDPRGEPAPVGAPGELLLAGACLARGYLGRPELTAEKFVPDPFAGEPGARAYRTGDRARWLADGTLEFLGRGDAQVKVRGHRVEPGEVEAALEAHPAVRQAVAAVRADAAGQGRLVAWVVAEDGAAPRPAELREHVGGRLPEYMVPSAVAVLAAFPLTPSGKVDRRSLPEPDAAAGEAEDYAAPETPTEEVLAGIFRTVLGAERIGARDDFFALGGHSLLATRVMSRVRDALGLDLPLREIFDASTVRALAARVDALLGAGAAAEESPLQRAPRDGRLRAEGAVQAPALVPVLRDRPLPASFAQQRLWFIDRMEPGSAAYNLPAALRLRGRLDARALRRALAGVVRRHESLRTVFAEAGGEPVQVVRPAAPVALPAVDLLRLSPEARAREAARLAAAEALRPFDLAAGPLLRASLLRLDAETWALLFSMHHVVADGWSVGVLVREVSALYTAFSRGASSPLPPLPVQYADYAAWQRGWLTGAALDAQVAWWRERLAGAPPLLELPTDRPRPATQDGAGASVPFALGAGAAGALRALAREEGATMFMALLAGWQLLLSRWSGQDDVSVGTPIAGRNRVETEGLIGFFVNTLVMRADLSGAPSFRALLGRAREGTLGAYHHQEVPFEKLVEELAPARSLRHAPLFQVMFAMTANALGELRMGDLETEPLGVGDPPAKFDLNLELGDGEGGVGGALSYRAELWERATVERMAGHLAALLEGVAADPDRPAAEVPFLGAAERSRVLEEWNATQRPYPAGPCVHDLFAAQARRTPAAVAISHRGETVTYAELDRRSARLANALRRRGVGPETRVGICLERTPELAVAMLGVLRAGGAYVPLDPAYPPARTAGMLEDAGVRLVVAASALAGRVPAGAAGLFLVDEEREALLAEPDTAPESGATAENLSHVIFTSGSTGRPKGVMVRHSSVVVLLHWLRETVADEERAGALWSTSASFDVSVAEVFGTLCWGGRLVLVENALELATVREPVVAAGMVPSAAAELLRSGGIPAGLRTLNLAGEALPEALARGLHALGTVAVLRNLYGPTEDTTYSTWALVGRGAERVSIGRPVANTRAYVLDDRHQPVPVGVAGELYLAGDGLARGYVGRPELTAERFVPDPFGEPGSRMYRVMDRVRWLAGGELEYLGRADQQVKVRGFRVEPGEVEATLGRHPSVLEAVVVAREDAPGDRRLVAYVVPAAGAAAVPAELRAFAGEHLPAYMVPAAVVVLEGLPLSSNGKIDRAALPAPEWTAAADAFVAPRTPTETTLAGIWARVLGVERVGADDDFFALGGHSLLATRVVSQIRDVMGVEVPLRTAFEAPTVAALAARVDSLRGAGAAARESTLVRFARERRLRTEAGAAQAAPPAVVPAPAPSPAPVPAPAAGSPPPLVPVPRDGSPLPVSFAQQRLWLLQQLDPRSAAYNMAFALRVRGRLDPGVLEAAVSEIVRRHETLRTVFPESDGRPVQVIRAPAPFAVPRTDLRALPEAARAHEARRLAGEEALRPFDLAAGPLLRVRVVRLDGEEWALLFTLHHVVGDGWSLGVIVRELSELYGALAEGRAPVLPPLPVQYADYAVWQRGWLVGATLEAQLAFWREQLRGAPQLLEIPTDRPRLHAGGDRGETRAFSLAGATPAALRALARREGATLFMSLLAAWQLLLGRWAGQDDVCVGTPVAGRARVQTEPLIGFFVNTLVMRADLSCTERLTFAGLLRQVRETALGAYAHQDLPFERLVEELAPERGAGRSPLFQVVFSLLTVEMGAPRMGGARMEPLPRDAEPARFDLSLTVAADEGKLAGTLLFRTDLFDGATVERMLGHYATLLAALAADPDAPVGRADMLSAAERAQLLHAWNDTAADLPRGLVHERIAQQAARTPHAPAVLFRERTLTYAELERDAGRLARRLRDAGVRVDDRVGILLERGEALVVAVLGILKAGAAYVALDPGHPDERLRFVLADAAASAVVATPELSPRLAGFAGAVVCPGSPLPQAPSPARGEGGPAIAPEPPVDPDNLAYVIYTSGSTGTPKGVLATHRGLANYLAWFNREVLGEDGFALPLVSRLSFDAHVRQLFPPLLRGEPVWVLPEETAADPAALLAALSARGRVSFGGVPALWSAMLERVRTGEAPKPAGLKAVLLGGEALSAELVERTRALFPGAAVWNHYGPTEATVNTTVARVDGAERVGIGRPIANVRVYLLDRRGEPVPVGVAGELYVGGAGVARGYLGRPALTAGSFLPDPFAGEAGARMYRSGDRARWLASGELDYVGRTDDQVKVRGFRIEPGEIEAALERHPAVREAVVAVRGERLVGWVVAEQDAEPSPAELRAWLADRLPEYMVPAAVAVLASLPLSPNGKTDRRALPDPEPAAGGAPFVAPRTAAEEAVAAAFAEVLQATRIGAGDDFFALGGHSLLAARVVSRVRAALGVELPLRAVFEAPTVGGLAERVDALVLAGDGLRAPPLVPVPREPGRPLPLSFAQQRLWLVDRIAPGSSAYNMPYGLRLRGAPDARLLERSLGEVVRRHESLRTVFALVDGEPVQTIRPPGPVRLPAVELRALRPADRERELRRLAAAEAARPFDLARGPLLRPLLAWTGADECALLFTLHHVVADAWSMDVLVREVSAAYAAFAEGRPSPLAPLPVQYTDFAVWQREWLSGEVLEAQLAWWRARLDGAPPVLDLPVDRPRPAAADPRAAAVGFAVPAGVARGVRALARSEGATPFMAHLAASAAMLARWSGQDDVVVGTPVAGRTHAELEGLIGFFVNTLALRTQLGGAPTLRELVGRARESLLGAQAHADLPFERLVEALSPERSLGHTPVFQATVALLDDAGRELRLGPARVEPLATGEPPAKFDLALTFRDEGEAVRGVLAWRAELWEEATAARMAAHVQAFLGAMAADPERRVADVELLSAAEREQLARWSDGGAVPPADACVHDLFAAQAARTPDAVALVSGGESLTYAELERRAGRLAAALRRRGVGPEVRVGVMLERTPELVAALLAVLVAGGAYVPLDPALPPERLGWMLEDAEAGRVLTTSALAGRLPAGSAAAIPLDALRDEIEAEGAGAPASGVLPENLSHVIFTSGSTGRPKGVMIRHRSVAARVRWLRDFVPDGERRSVLFSTSVSFDVSVAEIWGTLCWGGRLVMVENALELATVREPVVLASMVPTAAAELLRSGGIPASVRALHLAGEPLSAELARALHATGTLEGVRNLYGPTEDTTYSTCSTVGRGGEVRIGRPAAGTRTHVLDAELRPAPVGVPGELYLAGEGTARGYARRPELTAERFLPDPAGPAGGRMYRTGDRVRWRAGGELESLGRTDQQVKVRGFRVELGEVEAALERHPGVARAAAVVRGDAPGGPRIVAYVVPAAEPVADEALRGHLRSLLPEYMLPGAFVALAALPLTGSGKTDRRALPAPERAEDAGAGGYLAPRDTLELALTRIWEDVLGLERVGVRDGFFALGGHSLLAVRLMARVEQATGARLPLAVLFTAPTVERLAAELRRGGARDDGSPLVPIRPGGSRAPLFLVHPVGGDVLAYAALARRLDPEQPVYGLRSRGLAAGVEPARTVEEMASDYLRAMREVQPAGPYRLGGWSMGGVVAFEMARRLEAAGERVERLVLVDAQVPALHGRVLPDDERELVRIFAQDMGLPPERLDLPEGGGEADARGYLGRVLEGARAAGVVPPDVDTARIEQLYAVFSANLAALYGYRPAAWAGAATLLRAAEHDPSVSESAGWERLLEGGVEVRSVPGSHFTLVREPHADALAREVERALDG